MIDAVKNFLLTCSIPIQKLMQKFHPPYAQTTVAEAEQVMKIMQDGDILLSREKWHFTNMFIKGFWSHAAIYGQGQVIEAVAPFVQVVDFRDWVIEKHFWCVLRPIKGPKDGYMVYTDAKLLEGLAYDYLFSFGNKKWYCSEVCREAQLVNLPQWMQDMKSQILPQAFYKAMTLGQLALVAEHHDG